MSQKTSAPTSTSSLLSQLEKAQEPSDTSQHYTFESGSRKITELICKEDPAFVLEIIEGNPSLQTALLLDAIYNMPSNQSDVPLYTKLKGETYFRMLQSSLSLHRRKIPRVTLGQWALVMTKANPELKNPFETIKSGECTILHEVLEYTLPAYVSLSIFLLKNGASITTYAKGRTPIMTAALYNNVDFLLEASRLPEFPKLIKEKDAFGRDSLSFALFNPLFIDESLPIVTSRYVRNVTLKIINILSEHELKVRYSCSASGKHTPLMSALYTNNFDGLDILLDHNLGCVNQQALSRCLHGCIIESQYTIFCKLLKIGANPFLEYKNNPMPYLQVQKFSGFKPKDKVDAIQMKNMFISAVKNLTIDKREKAQLGLEKYIQIVFQKDHNPPSGIEGLFTLLECGADPRLCKKSLYNKGGSESVYSYLKNVEPATDLQCSVRDEIIMLVEDGSTNNDKDVQKMKQNLPQSSHDEDTEIMSSEREEDEEEYPLTQEDTVAPTQLCHSQWIREVHSEQDEEMEEIGLTLDMCDKGMGNNNNNNNNNTYAPRKLPFSKRSKDVAIEQFTVKKTKCEMPTFYTNFFDPENLSNVKSPFQVSKEEVIYVNEKLNEMYNNNVNSGLVPNSTDAIHTQLEIFRLLSFDQAKALVGMSLFNFKTVCDYNYESKGEYDKVVPRYNSMIPFYFDKDGNFCFKVIWKS